MYQINIQASPSIQN